MKKQIAVLMAAATAVTTVAPALASAADVNKYEASTSEINAKIKAALNERYKDKTQDGIKPVNPDDVDAYLNSRYAVAIKTSSPVVDTEKYDIELLSQSKYKSTDVANELKSPDVFGGNQNVYIVKDASKVQGLIENQVIGNDGGLKVAIVDKGMTKDGSAVETISEKHYVVNNDMNLETDTTVSLNNLANSLNQELKNKEDNKPSYIDTLKVTDNTGEESSYNDINQCLTNKNNVTKVKLTLESGKEYTLEANDKAFDLTKPVDKNGNEIDLTSANDQTVLDTIEGFKFIENKDDKKVTIDLPLGDTSLYTIQDVEASTMELGKIFTTKDGYTKSGEDFVNSIVDARAMKDGSPKFNYNGKAYILYDRINGQVAVKTGSDAGGTDNAFYVDEKPKSVSKPVIEKVGDGYQLRYNVAVADAHDWDTKLVLQFVIKGDSQKDLATVLSDLNGKNDVVAGHFTKLSGSDRYSTAVDVSVDRFNPREADTVVIVGGEALMDGLSSVPLAKYKNAPILLSHPKSGLNDATLNEIGRACKDLNRKTVYVVGGENSVPEKAVKQLEDKFGAVVMRISGTDRYETSKEVAKRLEYDAAVKPADSDLFIVGGEGAADAMSISPVAANNKNNKISPVLVVPQSSLKRSTKDFIKTYQNGNKYIVGGESTVSSNVYRDIVSVDPAKKVSRISGGDRYDTNVQIIKQFYSADGSKIQVNGAIFTSGDTKFLVDAQTAGPLAASKNAPIVLAGSKLTNDQVNLLKKGGVLANVKTNVYQVGGVVSSDVMSVVVDKLGL